MITAEEKQAISFHYKKIAENFKQFKNRASQRVMIAEIAKTFAEETSESQEKTIGQNLLVIEAPTGVGKSLAYLLAGTIMAQFRNKTLVVSSATIALQQQLIFKDLPNFQSASELKISYCLAKGRDNYLCPYRLYQLTQRPTQSSLAIFNEKIENSSGNEQEILLFKNIAEKFANREFLGDREEWPNTIPDNSWLKINNNRHICLRKQCPNIDECPFFLIREEFNKADIIVANHDLLLSDLELGGGVILPEPKNCFYCIDEAHHLAKRAVNHFAASCKLSEMKLLSENLQLFIMKLNNIIETVAIAQNLILKVEGLESIFYDLEYYFDKVNEDVFDFQEDKTLGTWILKTEDFNETLVQIIRNLAIKINLIEGELSKAQDQLFKLNKDSTQYSYEKLTNEFAWLISITARVSAVWQIMLQKENTTSPLAKWVIYSKLDKLDYEFHASPILAGDRLEQMLWLPCAGAILTSATLRSVNSFQLLLEQTGLNRFSMVKTMVLDTPFKYEEQVELYIPNLLNTPKQNIQHTEEIAQLFPKLIDITQPIGTLFLFSSKKQMNDVYALLTNTLKERILKQGDLPKKNLISTHLERIKSAESSIIFGLQSFAEGLDLKGDLCVHVIIAKIPFSAPDNPIDKVYRDWIEQQGKNSFTEISIPEASIKLSQAMGRLIRSESDYGRITILDTRLLTSSYGKLLLSGFPRFKRIY